MRDSGAAEQGNDLAAIRATYARARAKRLTPSRGVIHDIVHDNRFASYLEDPFTAVVDREPVVDDVDVVIVGAGMSGIVLGAKLQESGLRRVRLVDRAGGVGGTWYWNRYPGLMCDIESYIYMPMLEEMNYVPTSRYASGAEIRRHLESIAVKYGLMEDALFHTGVESSEWNEAVARWIVRTDRGDEIRARFLVLAVGVLNLMKLPVIPGMEDFEGSAFHSGRWRYDLTGGSQDDPVLTELSDKAVGVIGIGGSAIQAVPQLAKHAKHVYAFQRTPSAVGVRGNRPTGPAFVDGLRPGWQRERMSNFSTLLGGGTTDVDLVDDGWTHHMAQLIRLGQQAWTSPELAAEALEKLDLAVMDEHRKRIDEVVDDPAVAESLKPYYRYLCKRPCFHDDYLASFNRSNVTIVDCPGGVERIVANGAIADGVEYELDCIVFATGYEAESTPLSRRVGHVVRGVDGITLEEKWGSGPVSLHGMTTAGFPNMFIMPAPGQQAVTTVNYTHLMMIGAEHIAESVAMLDERGVRYFDVTPEAEAAWTDRIVADFRDNRAFMAACTPSRMNFEGHPDQVNARNGTYGGGYGDVLGFTDVLEKWRANASFRGWTLATSAPAK